MKHKIIKFRGSISSREIIADIIFLLVSAIISFLAIVIFNIHWSFYPGNVLFPPSKTVGISSNIYIIGTLAGSLAGFFIIKLLLIGVKEEEKQWFDSKVSNKKR